MSCFRMTQAMLWLSALLAMTAQADSRIESDLQQALDLEGTVRATILFELEAAIDAAGLSREERRAQRMAAVARGADAVIAAIGENIEVHRRFNLVSAVVAYLDQAALDRVLALETVQSVGLDPGGEGHVDVARALMGIDTIQALPPTGLGELGANTKVVVMDSGIDSDNVDFSGALVDEACFCFASGAGCCPNGNTTQLGTGSAEDDHNHGTWVSGHVLSRGNDAPRGAAPAASLVAVKVLDSNNSFCCASDVTAGFDWVATNHPDAQVLNASLGTFARFGTECSSTTTWLQAMSQASGAVVANGTLMTASAGNDFDTTGIGAPSCLGDVMGVGATYKQDYTVASCPPSDEDSVTCYSNVAPILEVLAPGSFMETTQRGGGTVTGLQGTSFASPLVAGCAALIRSAYPSASAAQVRAALVSTGAPILDTRVGLTFPRVDCLAAIQSFNTLIFDDRFESP